MWRLIDGKAQYVHYRIFDEPDSTDLPPVDGVRNGKCEYGLEILITLAYLVYWTGVSIDNRSERQARTEAMARKALAPARPSVVRNGAASS